MHLLREAFMLVMAFGATQAIAGLLAVRLFVRREPHPVGSLPPVTILKPICGDETMLEEAIASFCVQQYPAFQMVIGAQDPHDPALRVARRVQARYPGCDITVIADPTHHGRNGKIANLMNMLPFAKHDTLVIADSDLHVRPDYLVRVVAALQRPGTGLVTTVGVAQAPSKSLAGWLGATHISHFFLPSALIAVALGRQDCLGGTMALRRETLAQIGDLGALVNHLADDNVLGRKVRRLGAAVRLADTIPTVVVQERSLPALWQHELRWARTIGALAPISFNASVIQLPLFWGLLAIVLSGAAPWAILGFAGSWAIRAAVALGIDHALRGRCARPATSPPLWLLPLRDLLSAVEIVASHWDDVVVWRGSTMRVDRGEAASASGPTREIPAACPADPIASA